ncbi:hypothetical protein BCR43DRAFT_68114 [Syncephalastrum racemosum]|uniref:Uncharacterized protein n=1 Tax=Syncephalastrum racemosum TaxID=13706 RepID=A0A1X2HWH1_SYNRA|nr:hypothetical protein BCR43DRAFT_68114 [Syncephalastrum racemosum]
MSQKKKILFEVVGLRGSVRADLIHSLSIIVFSFFFTSILSQFTFPPTMALCLHMKADHDYLYLVKRIPVLVLGFANFRALLFLFLLVTAFLFSFIRTSLLFQLIVSYSSALV